MDLISSQVIRSIKGEREILDLCIGYCKSKSIPLNINYLIAIYYFARKAITIGKLIFATKYILYTSLTASIIIKNLIFKFDVKIGQLTISLFLNQNKYNTNTNKDKRIIQTISGHAWNSNYVINDNNDKCHKYYKPKQYRILFLINRETNCHCADSEYEIKIYILNFTIPFNSSWYTICRGLERRNDDKIYNQQKNGLIKIKLPSDIDIQKTMEIITNESDKGTVEICGGNQSGISFNNVIEGRMCCWDTENLIHPTC